MPEIEQAYVLHQVDRDMYLGSGRALVADVNKARQFLTLREAEAKLLWLGRGSQWEVPCVDKRKRKGAKT